MVYLELHTVQRKDKTSKALIAGLSKLLNVLEKATVAFLLMQEG